MAAESTGAKRLRDLTADFQDGVGQRLRSERERHGVELRELARRLEISPSALSQYSMAVPPAAPAPAGHEETGATLVQRHDTRKGIELESGVRWERLTPTAEPDADFLSVVYEVGGASSREGTHMRHMGREYGLVLSGRLRVTIGFDEEHELGPGDSIAFESSRPHRLENAGAEPVEAIWFVVGRSHSDARKLALDASHEGAPGPAEPR